MNGAIYLDTYKSIYNNGGDDKCESRSYLRILAGEDLNEKNYFGIYPKAVNNFLFPFQYPKVYLSFNVLYYEGEPIVFAVDPDSRLPSEEYQYLADDKRPLDSSIAYFKRWVITSFKIENIGNYNQAVFESMYQQIAAESQREAIIKNNNVLEASSPWLAADGKEYFYYILQYSTAKGGRWERYVNYFGVQNVFFLTDKENFLKKMSQYQNSMYDLLYRSAASSYDVPIAYDEHLINSNSKFPKPTHIFEEYPII